MDQNLDLTTKAGINKCVENVRSVKVWAKCFGYDHWKEIFV